MPVDNPDQVLEAVVGARTGSRAHVVRGPVLRDRLANDEGERAARLVRQPPEPLLGLDVEPDADGRGRACHTTLYYMQVLIVKATTRRAVCGVYSGDRVSELRLAGRTYDAQPSHAGSLVRRTGLLPSASTW